MQIAPSPPLLSSTREWLPRTLYTTRAYLYVFVLAQAGSLDL